MKYQQKKDAIILLEDGSVFYGKTPNTNSAEIHTSFGEICFNTGMTGYQEIFTDPSYYGQIMVTTNAHIGNYGTNAAESESNSAKIAGLVCKNFSMFPSRVNMDKSLDEFLLENKLLVVSDVDTRALVSYIREHGAMNAVISTKVDDVEDLRSQLAKQPSMKGLALSSKVSTKEIYDLFNDEDQFKVAVLDLGVKQNILKHLQNRKCSLKVFPWDSSFEEVMSWSPDALFISNGPGDPEPLTNAIEVAKKAIEKDVPLFGICLGQQIISLALGIPTQKMHHGHRGINHPILNLETGKGEITSQNHGFVVEKEAAEKSDLISITHKHLNDDSIAGFSVNGKKCFCVQYHPEAGPGPNDANYLFDDFIEMIKKA
jgi:carbamoyl-phosphate synthase small subunit